MLKFLKKLFGKSKQPKQPTEFDKAFDSHFGGGSDRKVDNARREMHSISRNSRRQIADHSHRNHRSRPPKGVVGYRV